LEAEAVDEEALIVWQDILDEIVAGRPNNLSCPYCNHTPLRVETAGRITRVRCDACSQYIEGAFGGS
jgi:transcription elongation factor Elf1